MKRVGFQKVRKLPQEKETNQRESNLIYIFVHTLCSSQSYKTQR